EKTWIQYVKVYVYVRIKAVIVKEPSFSFVEIALKCRVIPPLLGQYPVGDIHISFVSRMYGTRHALHIRGKNLATYTPSVDMGAFVIVVNADKVVVSGKKRTQKLYRRHSGRPGGMTVETFDQLQQRIPERIVEHATIWQDSNMLELERTNNLTVMFLSSGGL
ncbi:50S ribosomal protein L13, chloroplastic, partial [Tanacetum coccineum]